MQMAQIDKFGWRVKEWGEATGLSRAFVYELLASGAVISVKVGAARIITTHPRDYLAALAGRPTQDAIG